MSRLSVIIICYIVLMSIAGTVVNKVIAEQSEAVREVTTDRKEQEEYTIKVRDRITVTVWEREWLSGTAVVDLNGQIILPKPIGTVRVLGLTLDQITALLTERLKEYIVEPIVSISISPALDFTVHITGEVKTPNFFNIMAGTTLQEVITRAGGFTDLADKKHIKIIRKASEMAHEVTVEPNEPENSSEIILDFTQFEENALPNFNPPLKNEDVVIVPRLPKSERMPTVMIMGAVKNPGDIPIEDPLPLIELLVRAGGPSINADLKNLSIFSFEDNKYSQKQLDFERFLNTADLSANPMVSSGEIVFVPEQYIEKELSFTVNVMGQVVKQGAYKVDKEGRLFDAIYAAGGFTDEAAIDKVTIIRPSNPDPQKIEINATNYLTTSDLTYNPLLEEGDTVFIPIQEVTKKIPGIQTAFFESIRLTIIGEVKTPNAYQVSKKANVLDVLTIAGGPTRDSNLERVMIIREKKQLMQIDLEKVLQEGKLQSLPPLQADDTIFVPKMKERRNIWKTVMRAALDVANVFTVYYFIATRIRD